MRALITEYGLILVAVLAGGFIFFSCMYALRRYGYYVNDFVGKITGAYSGYASDISLEDIEKNGLSEYQLDWYKRIKDGFEEDGAYEDSFYSR